MTGLYGMVQDQEVNFLLEKDSSPTRQAAKGDEGTVKGTVTIRGDLSNMSLGDVFQTLGMASMEGTLRMRSMFESRDVYFRNGQVRCLSPLRVEARRVGRRLVDAGLISNDHLRASLMEQRQNGGLLGQILVQRGAITEETLERVLAAQVEEDLYALFTWRKGTFEFYKEENPEKARKELEISHPFDINQVLLEVARRSDEWINILEWISDLDEIFTPMLEASHEHLKDFEITVLSQVDGRRTVREIADQLLASLFETARAFRALLTASVIEKASTTELIQLASQLSGSGETRRAAVVLSLTRELREITDPAQVRQISDLYSAAGEMRVASRVLSEYSWLGKKRDDVLEILRDAFRLDSGNVDALGKLKDLLGDDDPVNTEERFAVDACLVDNLVEQSRLEEALAIVQTMTMSRPDDPACLSRKARVLYKLGRKDDAVAALVTLAEVMRLQGRTDQLQPIYDQILKVDPSRKDVIRSLHSLHAARRSRIRRMVYLVAGVTALLLAGFFVTTRQIYASRIDRLISRSKEMLDKGALEEGKKIALEAVKEAGTGHRAAEAKSTLLMIEKRRKADLEAAETLRESRFRARTDRAGNLLESGNWTGALEVYRKLHEEEPEQRTRISSVLEARLTAVAAELEEALHEATSEPVPKDTESPADARAEVKLLEQIYPPSRKKGLESMASALEKRALAELTADTLAERLQSACIALLKGHTRAEKRLTLLKLRLDEDSLKEKLNPTFVAARKAEEEHRFADALRCYETLAAEYRGDSELRTHFRDMLDKYRAIGQSLRALEADTNLGDFASAHKRLRALVRSFPDIPFARLVELPATISTVPAGAVVKVAEKNVGVTPVTIRFVPGADDGKPTAQIEKEGFVPESVALGRDARGEVNLLLTRKPDWSVELPGPVDQDMAYTASGRLYVPDRSGRLHRIDPASGQILWTFESGDPSGLVFTPCEQGDRVFLSSLDRSVRALSVEDGRLVWKIDLDALVRGGPVATPAGIAIATDRGTILVLDPGSGARLRTVEGKSAYRIPLVSSPQRVVAASEDGTVRGFHPDTFAQRWVTSVSGAPRSASISQGMVIIGCEDRSIHVLSLADGKKKWSSDLQESVRLCPAVSGRTLWVATERRELWRFDLLTGGDRKRVPIQDLPSSSLAVDDTRFLAGMRSGTVFALAFDEATPAFRMAATKAVSSAPIVLPDGTVVIASEDRSVRAYKRSATGAPRPQK